MAQEQEIKSRIVERAHELFFQHGFSKVTMEEIASMLGMSKKTLYQHFPSKHDLMREVILSKHSIITNEVEKIMHDEELDFVEKIRQLLTFVAVHMSKISQHCIQDLYRNVPDIWKLIKDFRHEKMFVNFVALLEEGINKGFIRSDIEVVLVAKMYISCIETMISPEVITELPYTPAQVFETIISVIFEGILTEDSRKPFQLVINEK